MISPPLEADVPVDFGKEGEVPAQSHVDTGVKARPALSDQDTPCAHQLTAEALDAEHLRLAVPAVSAAPYAFFMCHGYASIFVMRTAVNGWRCPFFRS